MNGLKLFFVGPVTKGYRFPGRQIVAVTAVTEWDQPEVIQKNRSPLLRDINPREPATRR